MDFGFCMSLFVELEKEQRVGLSEFFCCKLLPVAARNRDKTNTVKLEARKLKERVKHETTACRDGETVFLSVVSSAAPLNIAHGCFICFHTKILITAAFRTVFC